MTSPLITANIALPDDEEPLDVLDLPQLYTQPAADLLLSTLSDLKSEPSSWGSTPTVGNSRNASGTSTPFRRRRKIKNDGIPAYLTKIISSRLNWIDDEERKEEIWQTASQELSARSGRSAQGDLTRTFVIPLKDKDDLDLILHEPALTADNVGWKTWASSFMLAKRLPSLRNTIDASTVLELGSGTGLLGIAAACILEAKIILTDLPEIVGNLEKNITTNASTIGHHNGAVEAAIMDWRRPDLLTIQSSDNNVLPHHFSLLLAADVVYSEDHAGLLSNAVKYHLATTESACLVLELPLRSGFNNEMSSINDELTHLGLCIVDQGEEVGYDDWCGNLPDEDMAEVRCWWSVWKWSKH